METYNTAVKWWSEILQTPNNNFTGSVMTSFYLSLLGQEVSKPEKIQIQRFEEELLKILQLGVSYLNVDYHPCRYLKFACGKAGISTALLPRKTSMRIENQEVYVRLGYNQPWEKITT